MGWKRGSVILEAKPYAHVICLKFREERCNFCLMSSENMKKCGNCKKIWYCGVSCQCEDDDDDMYTYFLDDPFVRTTLRGISVGRIGTKREEYVGMHYVSCECEDDDDDMYTYFLDDPFVRTTLRGISVGRIGTKRKEYVGMHYVSCEKEDWKVHKLECQVMKRVPDTPTDSLRLYLRLIIRYLVGAARVTHPEDESPCLRTFSDLMSHADKIKMDSTRSEQFRIAADFLRAYSYGILQLPGDDVLLDIFGKMVINTFTITDEMLQDVGVAVYTSPSTLDHRCWPNAVATFDGRKVIIRAVDNIASDSLSDVFLCYVDSLATTAERVEQLEQQYYFTCNCDRCQNKEVDAMMCSIEGSNEGDLRMVKDCLEKIEHMRKEQAKPKDILVTCEQCLNKVTLPFGNVFLVRLVGKAFDAAIDAEEWETALLLSIKNYKPYSILHHPFNPCVGYLLANMGKLLMLVGRLSEAFIHLSKALENFTVSLGENHYLYKQVTEMMTQCEAEMEQTGAG